MKKFISFIFALIIVAALLFMGIMEKTLSGVGGNKAVIFFYVILGIILFIMYMKAKKASDAEDEKFENSENTELTNFEEFKSSDDEDNAEG